MSKFIVNVARKGAIALVAGAAGALGTLVTKEIYTKAKVSAEQQKMKIMREKNPEMFEERVIGFKY